MKIKRGTVREDGKIFRGYINRKYEWWVTPERFRELQEYDKNFSKLEKCKQYRKERYKRIVSTEEGRIEFNRVSRKNNRKYKEKNKNKIKEYNSRPEVLEKARENKKKRWKNNPKKLEEYRKNRKEYMKNRRGQDIMFKTIGNLRHRLKEFLKTKGWRKNSPTTKLLGCSKEEFRIYIKNKFETNMTWDNYGNGDNQWSYDHIIPLSSATCLEELYKLCHYTNIQPLWHKDNIIKSNKHF